MNDITYLFIKIIPFVLFSENILHDESTLDGVEKNLAIVMSPTSENKWNSPPKIQLNTSKTSIDSELGVDKIPEIWRNHEFLKESEKSEIIQLAKLTDNIHLTIHDFKAITKGLFGKSTQTGGSTKSNPRKNKKDEHSSCVEKTTPSSSSSSESCVDKMAEYTKLLNPVQGKEDKYSEVRDKCTKFWDNGGKIYHVCC